MKLFNSFELRLGHRFDTTEGRCWNSDRERLMSEKKMTKASVKERPLAKANNASPSLCLGFESQMSIYTVTRSCYCMIVANDWVIASSFTFH